jgi:TetR/AcrR family transcriptional regulator
MPRSVTRRDSKSRILQAAAAEFAARGFAGAGVDRIARRARLNKAMIYYHFRSKEALYHHILQDMFLAAGNRLASIAAGPRPPEEKLDAFIEALAEEGQARPHFPPIMLRELAEGATRLDPATLQLMTRLLEALSAILAEGVGAGRFRDVNPLATHLTIISPLIIYLATAPVRTAIRRLGLLHAAGVDALSPAAFIAHLQEMTRSALESDGTAETAPGERRHPVAPHRKAGSRLLYPEAES